MASAIPKLHHGWKESAMEAESRKAADFPKIEGELYEHLVKSEMTPILDKVTSESPTNLLLLNVDAIQVFLAPRIHSARKQSLMSTM